MPDMIGTWPPRNDDAAVYDFYCASMLLLLKPWRGIECLKDENETWRDALRRFEGGELGREKESETFDETDLDDEIYDNEDEVYSFNEEELQLLKKKEAATNGEAVHGTVAVEAGRAAGFFADETADWALTEGCKRGTIASQSDLQKIERWKTQMMNDIKINDEQRQAEQRNLSARSTSVEPSVQPLDEYMDEDEDGTLNRMPQKEAAMEAVDVSLLHEDQRRAYDCIVWHLEETLAGKNPQPMRMLLIGEGGTGKSKVIQCVTKAFQQRKCTSRLVKSAYTGIAASSGPKRQELEQFWAGKDYLIIDEISMISRRFFGLLSRNISVAKTTTTNTDAIRMYKAGINVIIVGDFHQFPPVASQGGPLYYPLQAKEKDRDVHLGRQVYEEFEQAVILTKQMRNSDLQWAKVLSRLRKGEIIVKDISLLRTLVLGDPSCPHTDFSKPPWSSAVLVTPRHGVRKQWNAQAIRKWCKESGNMLYSCYAEDSYRGAAKRINRICRKFWTSRSV